MRRASSETGSATIVVLAAVALIATLTGVVYAATEFSSTRARVSAAADLAALAAADSSLIGEGCAAARSVAARNDAHLTSCEIHGFDAIVAVESRPRGLMAWFARQSGHRLGAVQVVARAGQPSNESRFIRH
jgi:secretion/DNA translocation related TadE-like protein